MLKRGMSSPAKGDEAQAVAWVHPSRSDQAVDQAGRGYHLQGLHVGDLNQVADWFRQVDQPFRGLGMDEIRVKGGDRKETSLVVSMRSTLNDSPTLATAR